MDQSETGSGASPLDRGFKREWISVIQTLARLFPELDLHRPLIEQVDSLTLFEVISRWESEVGRLDDECVDWIARKGVSDQDMDGIDHFSKD